MLQNVQLIRWCAEEGIIPLWNLLYGFPGEQPEDYRKMAEVIPALSHLHPPSNVYLIRLVRFSPYFREPEAYGLRNVRPHRTYRHLYPNMSEEALAQRAFRFEFEFSDGRDLSYCDETIKAVKSWMHSRARGALIGFDTEDGGLLVWDGRAIADSAFTQLTPAEASVLRACDRIRLESSLHEELRRAQVAEASLSAIADHVKALERRRFLLREEGKVLGVVVMRPGMVAPALPASQIVRLR